MDTREQNIDLHIKAMEDRCQANENKILTDPKLTPDEIVALRLKQVEYQQALQWLANIKLEVFPPRILKPTN